MANGVRISDELFRLTLSASRAWREAYWFRRARRDLNDMLSQMPDGCPVAVKNTLRDMIDQLEEDQDEAEAYMDLQLESMALSLFGPDGKERENNE